MFYKVLLEKRAGREKIAVNLDELRKAFRARVTPNLIRTKRSDRNFLRQLERANVGRGRRTIQAARIGNTAGIESRSKIMSMPLNDAYKQGKGQAMFYRLGDAKGRYDWDLDGLGLRRLRAVKRMRQKLESMKPADRKPPRFFIVQGGDVSRTLSEAGGGVKIPKSKTPEAREAFNRTVGLHEATEMASARRSPSRDPDGPTFFSHQGVQPMLNDVNIANTFTGTGAKEFKAQVDAMRAGELRGLKETLAGDPKAEALVERLLAGGRINRHERKYLDRQYAQAEGLS